MNFFFNILILSFLALVINRLLPLPPNLTILIAMTFYLTKYYKFKGTIVATLAFAISDLIIGIHSLTLFTWFSILIIGFFQLKLFKKINLTNKYMSMLSNCLIFFIISNFGVWLFSEMYSNNMSGLLQCYFMAIPFFGYTVFGTVVGALIFEFIFQVYKNSKFLKLYFKNN